MLLPDRAAVVIKGSDELRLVDVAVAVGVRTADKGPYLLIELLAGQTAPICVATTPTPAVAGGTAIRRLLTLQFKNGSSPRAALG